MDILDGIGQRTRTNLFAAAGNLVTLLSGQPNIGDTAKEMWKQSKFRRGFLQNKTAAQILTSTQFWIQHIWPNLPTSDNAVDRAKALNLAIDIFGVEVHDYLESRMGLECYTKGDNPNPPEGGAARQWTPQEIAAVIQQKISMMDRNREKFTFVCGANSRYNDKRKREDSHDSNVSEEEVEAQSSKNEDGQGRPNKRRPFRKEQENPDRCTDPFCNRNGRRPTHTNAECRVQRAKQQGTWRYHNNQGGCNQHNNGTYNRNNGHYNGGGRDNRNGGNRYSNGNRYTNQNQWRNDHQNNDHRGHDNFVMDIAEAVMQRMQSQQNRNGRSHQPTPESE